MIKYASNAFLAIKIHYINELADFCEKCGANVHDVAKGMGLDSRIGPKFLNPGPGYGGSCFPKDTKALDYMANQAGADLSLVSAAITGNESRISKMAAKILDAAKDAKNPRVAVWGLAFKDGTDDVRESPALQIVQELVSRGANVVAFDPKAMENARAVLGDSIKYAADAVAAADGADVLAVLTEWHEFREVPLDSLNMAHRRIVDLRGIISAKAAAEHGFEYTGIGK
jgi:UDPglucose 6-dehydrogenase